MKTPFRFIIAVTLVGSVSAIGQSPMHYRLQPPTGEPSTNLFLGSGEKLTARVLVRSVHGGEAEARTLGADWARLKVGFTATEGVTFRTKKDATVDLFLGANGPVVRMTKDTTLRFLRLRQENTGIEKVIETILHLSKGRILGNVKKMAKDSLYEVRTPRGVASIRGTEYSISAEGDMYVSSGSVLFWDRTGKRSINLQSGQSFFPRRAAKDTPIDPLFEQE